MCSLDSGRPRQTKTGAEAKWSSVVADFMNAVQSRYILSLVRSGQRVFNVFDKLGNITKASLHRNGVLS